MRSNLSAVFLRLGDRQAAADAASRGLACEDIPASTASKLQRRLKIAQQSLSSLEASGKDGGKDVGKDAPAQTKADSKTPSTEGRQLPPEAGLLCSRTTNGTDTCTRSPSFFTRMPCEYMLCY